MEFIRSMKVLVAVLASAMASIGMSQTSVSIPDSLVIERTREYIKPHEGYEAKAYPDRGEDDPKRKWTVGYGFNLEAESALALLERVDTEKAREIENKIRLRQFSEVTIDQQTADELLDKTIENCLDEIRSIWSKVHKNQPEYADFDKLPVEAQIVALDMLYQVGGPEFMGYNQDTGDYEPLSAWYGFFPPFDDTIVPLDYSGSARRLENLWSEGKIDMPKGRAQDHIEQFKMLAERYATSTVTVILDVPFKAQYPPGDWDNETNCGQASALMVFCYYSGEIPTRDKIEEIDDWLHSRYGDPINNYNGTFTDRHKLAVLAREYGKLTQSYTKNYWTIQDIEACIDGGCPVITAIAGRVPLEYNRDGEWLQKEAVYSKGHWVVVTGYSDQQIICNDPKLTFGRNARYGKDMFLSAMYDQWDEALSNVGDADDWKGAVVVVLPEEAVSNASTTCQNSCALKGSPIDFGQWGWANPLPKKSMYVSSGGGFLDPNYPVDKKRHIGVDFLGRVDAGIAGHPVYSICDGRVIQKHITSVENSFLAIASVDRPLVVIYGHVKEPENGTKVNINDTIRRGQEIASIADFTRVDPQMPSHLHLGMNVKGKYYFYGTAGWGRCRSGEPDTTIAEKGWVDPMLYLCEHPSEGPTGTSGLATALVMDKSGSMRGEKLERAQEAAYVYVDTSGEGEDLVSLAAFDASGESVVEPISIESGREKLKQKILSLSSGGSTNVGAGLAVAYEHLSMCELESRAAVLLSDGENNSGSYDAEVIKFEQAGWPISTVAFGKDADQEMLSEIAYRTGGTFSPAGLSDISRVYHKMNVQTHLGSVLQSYSEFVRPGTTLRYNVPVEADMTKIGFFTDWQGSNMKTSLVSPRGQRITEENCRDYGRYVSGETHNLLEIENPQAGDWKVDIAGHDLPRRGEQVNFHCYGVSGVFSNMLGFQPSYSSRKPVRIGVKLANVQDGHLTSLTGATVTAEIKKPSSRLKSLALGRSSQSSRSRVLRADDVLEILTEVRSLTRKITLYDDGLHDDFRADDGIYGNTYEDATSNGPYLVTIDCDVRSITGKRMRRKLQESFQVGRIERNSFTISDFLGILTEQGHGRDLEIPVEIEGPEAEEVIDSVLDRIRK